MSSTIRPKGPRHAPGPGASAALRRIVLALFSALLLLGAQVPSAHAEGELTWSIAPADNEHGSGRPNFAYAIAPGDTLTDAIVIRNQSASELTLTIYAADGFTTTSGDLDLLPADQPSAGLGTWVSASVPEVRIPAGGSEHVTFTIAVPADAQPGDHSGGIITSHSSSSGAVRVDQRFALRIHARVPGELAATGEITDLAGRSSVAWNPFDRAEVDLAYSLVNTGNTRAFYEYRAELSGPFGLGRRTEVGTLPELTPGSRLTPQLAVDQVLPLFLLSGEITVTPQSVDGLVGDQVVAPLRIWSIPWGVLGLILVVVGVAAAVGVRRARRDWEYEDDETDQPAAHSDNAPPSSLTV